MILTVDHVIQYGEASFTTAMIRVLAPFFLIDAACSQGILPISTAMVITLLYLG